MTSDTRIRVKYPDVIRVDTRFDIGMIEAPPTCRATDRPGACHHQCGGMTMTDDDNTTSTAAVFREYLESIRRAILDADERGDEAGVYALGVIVAIAELAVALDQ